MAKNEYTKYLHLKFVIERLFGSDAWYALKESNHIPTWRKYGIKTLRAIAVSIEATVEVFDGVWRKDIDAEIAEGIERIKACKEIDEIIASLAGTLICVSFMQIGHMPNRRSAPKPPTLRKDAWRFDAFRTVTYTQTKKQKEQLFYVRQQREIGHDAQFELRVKYRQSKSKLPYSEWCVQEEKRIDC